MAGFEMISLDDDAAVDPETVGTKAASLARMKQAGLPVPDGFVVPAQTGNSGDGSSDSANDDAKAGGAAELPPSVREAVVAAYEVLGDDVPVAVRSSGTAEDLSGASFAGLYETHLNVRGREAVIEAMQSVLASLDSSYAAAYRQRHNISEDEAAMAILVQRQRTERY